MRWQKLLRWVIAAAGVSFAVFLYLRFDRKPAVTPAPLPEALPKGASYQSTMGPVGRQCRFDNGKEVSCISYSKFTQYTDSEKDGKKMLEVTSIEEKSKK